MSGLVLVPRDEAIQVAIPKLFTEMALTSAHVKVRLLKLHPRCGPHVHVPTGKSNAMVPVSVPGVSRS